MLQYRAGGAAEGRGAAGEGVDGGEETEEVMDLVQDDTLLQFRDTCAHLLGEASGFLAVGGCRGLVLVCKLL